MRPDEISFAQQWAGTLAAVSTYGPESDEAAMLFDPLMGQIDQRAPMVGLLAVGVTTVIDLIDGMDAAAASARLDEFARLSGDADATSIPPPLARATAEATRFLGRLAMGELGFEPRLRDLEDLSEIGPGPIQAAFALTIATSQLVEHQARASGVDPVEVFQQIALRVELPSNRLEFPA